MTITEPWVSVEDVAAHLGVARDSVYRWIEGRGLPAHKVGRIWKFKLSEVDDWVRAGGAGDAVPESSRAPKRTAQTDSNTTRKS
jgi:excisionase family DNA binding protein